MYLLKMLLKLKCRRFKKNSDWKKYFMILNPILNPNPNLGIQTMEFKILCSIKRPKQGILKSMDIKSRHFKFINLKSKCCHPNTTLTFFFFFFARNTK